MMLEACFEFEEVGETSGEEVGVWRAAVFTHCAAGKCTSTKVSSSWEFVE